MFKSGYKQTPEHTEKIRLSNLGRKFSDATKKKMSNAKKGKPNWKKGMTFPYKERPGMKGKPAWNKGKKFSEESKKKMSAAHKGCTAWNKGKKCLELGAKLVGRKVPYKARPAMIGKNVGEKNNMWKGGITSENVKIRHSIEFRLWRESVFARDHWTCQQCGKVGGNLNAHHLKEFADYPALRFAIDNGQTLCVPCHNKTKKTNQHTVKITNT